MNLILLALPACDRRGTKNDPPPPPPPPPTGCASDGELPPGALAAELGVTGLRVSEAVGRTFEVEILGPTGLLATAWLPATLEDEPSGVLMAFLESTDGGEVSLARRTTWVDGDDDPLGIDDRWLLDGVPLSTLVTWGQDDEIVDARWSTPARPGEPVPAGGYLWSEDGDDQWGLRTVEPADAWLDEAGLTAGWARAELLHAILADDVWAAGAGEAGCDPSTARGERSREQCLATIGTCTEALLRCEELTRPGTRAHRRACARAVARCDRVTRDCADANESPALCAGFDSSACAASCGGHGFCIEGDFECHCESSAPCGDPYLHVPVEQAPGGEAQTCSACGAGEGCSAGDPHLVTFDRTFFDYQGAGEYVLARSDDGAFEVQVRTVAHPGCLGFATNERIAVLAGGARIEIDGTGQGVTVDGELLANLSAVTRGARVSRTDPTVVVESPQGDRVTVTSTGIAWLDVTVAPSPTRAGAMSGLLGDMDGDPTDDFATADGYVPATPVDVDYLRWAFGGSWRVTDATSLFTYGPGETTATFTDDAFSPVPGPDDVPADRRADAEATCAATGAAGELFDACVVDVGCGGDGDTFFGELGAVEPAEILPPEHADPCAVRFDQLTADPDGVTRFTCLPDCAANACWGTDVYTGDSSVCTAATHDGRLGPAGGLVAFRSAAATTFSGSTQNGVNCGSWAYFPSSFTFVDP